MLNEDHMYWLTARYTTARMDFKNAPDGPAKLAARLHLTKCEAEHREAVAKVRRQHTAVRKSKVRNKKRRSVAARKASAGRA